MASTFGWERLGIALSLGIPLTASISLQDAFQPASRDICSLAAARVAIAADTLYFMGGRYDFGRGGGKGVTEPRLYSILLNDSFPVDTLLTSDMYSEINAPAQWAKEGAFFQDADETMLYSFAGYRDQGPISELNAFNISSSEWSLVTINGGDFNYGRRPASSNAVSKGTSEALGFITGSRETISGMIRFNASDPIAPQWRNETDDTPPARFRAGMEFIRLGSQGSLIYFGGESQADIDENPDPSVYSRLAMDQINVYDIASATWYSVIAGGDIPSHRTAFCTAVSSASDDSSFQITIYGGFDQVSAVSYIDTYVLSIPSFQWINVTDDSTNLDAQLTEGAGNPGRRLHRCVAYKDRQMLVLGGEFRLEDETRNFHGCHERFPVVKALDLGTFAWKSEWDGDPEPYIVPEVVRDVIGGDEQGGATMTEPHGGFNNSALSTAFAQTAPRYSIPRASTSLPSREPSPDGPSDIVTGTGTDTGAIVGGAVGGPALVALIAALVFLWRRRKRRAAAAPGWDATAPGWDAKLSPELHPGESLHELGGAGWRPRPRPVVAEMDAGYRGTEVSSE